MSLLGVVQQMLQALAQAQALRFHRFGNGFRVERQKVTWRGHGHPLLHCELNAAAGFVVGLKLVGHLSEGARIEQIHLRGEGGGWVAGPLRRGKAAVSNCDRNISGHTTVLQTLVPNGGGLGDVVGLQLHQCVGRQPDAGERIDQVTGAGCHAAHGVLHHRESWCRSAG